MSQPAPLLALEPHGARRREQLVRAAAFVIETEGIDAMQMPRVAEVAHCARSLVDRYFPRREDLYASPRLGVELNERLGEVSARMERAWVAPLREAGLGEVEASLVIRSAVALLTELLDRHRKGELSRDRALALGHRALAALVVALRADAEEVSG